MDGGPASSKPASQLAGGFRSNPVADRADTLTPLENRHGLRRTAFLGDDMVGGTRDIPSSRAHITIGPTMGVAGSYTVPWLLRNADTLRPPSTNPIICRYDTKTIWCTSIRFSPRHDSKVMTGIAFAIRQEAPAVQKRGSRKWYMVRLLITAGILN